jgi:uncharacterized membrane protein YcaP (DUF421 family)
LLAHRNEKTSAALVILAMDKFWQIDWPSIFSLTVSPLEIILRGTAVYLFLFLILRFLRRGAGALGITDLLVVVLIADAAQNAMSNDYKSIPDGIILVSTIAFWDYLLDWLVYRFSSLQRLLRPAPLLLIKDGTLQRRNMQQELITKEELLGQLREHGVERPEEVKECYLEADGHISVIAKQKKDRVADKPKQVIS